MSEHSEKVSWRREYRFNVDAPPTERVRKEYITPSDGTIMGDLTLEKNRCAKQILESIELTYGKSSRHWSSVRRIILRCVNDYHRTVVKSMNELMDELDAVLDEDDDDIDGKDDE